MEICARAGFAEEFNEAQIVVGAQDSTADRCYGVQWIMTCWRKSG